MFHFNIAKIKKDKRKNIF